MIFTVDMIFDYLYNKGVKATPKLSLVPEG